MMDPLPSGLAALEDLVVQDPDSWSKRHDVLLEFLAFPDLHADPRRIDHIRWFVDQHPRKQTCRTPVVAIDPASSPLAFTEIEELWLRHLSATPDDPDIVMGLAYHQSSANRQRGSETLRSYLLDHPDAGPVWFELGRQSCDMTERLAAFLRARALGFEHPNLLPWTALLAAEVGDRDTATRFAEELLRQNEALRGRFGEKLDWSEAGTALWQRARAVTPNDAAARKLVSAIAFHAHAKHHAHTALGLVALLDGRVDKAIEHLRASAEVGHDSRLSSYGAELSLARRLCEYGRWADVLAFVRDCAKFWDDESLPGWIEELEQDVIPSAWSSEVHSVE